MVQSATTLKRDFRVSILFVAAVVSFLHSRPSAAESGLAANQAKLAARFTSLIDSLQKLRISHCVPPVSKRHITVLQQVSLESFETFNRKYSAYTISITKPMSGNGKCDGGFNSVAAESQKRAQETSDFENQVFRAQSYFKDNFRGHYVDVPIFISDESEELDCQQESGKAYDQGMIAGLDTNDGFRSVRKDLIRTELEFRKYSSQNSTLGSDCGKIPGDLTSMVMGVGGLAQPRVLGVKAENPESTVTGKVEGSDYSISAGVKVDRLGFGDIPAEGSSRITGSTDTSNPSVGPVKSDGSAQQRRAVMKTLNQFGNSLVTVDGKQGNSRSEESAVSNLLRTGTEGSYGRDPANATNAHNLSVLELAIEAKNRADHSSQESAGSGASATAKKSAEATAQFNASLGSPEVSLFDRIHAHLRPRK